jgi:hypothetical protein
LGHIPFFKNIADFPAPGNPLILSGIDTDFSDQPEADALLSALITFFRYL